ncbi:alpha/beta fold hydrolase [Streptomyces sp. MUM 203J]|uniref:alpha/beta fold hydrolase n=1 Tax=Streptomyces sp. MUM 203J TaxID=2791990 RepID=UPI001F040BBC|nr:alpha/beta hydrolase [Streptomyces sp. MUM 203J]MCH0539811.1 alpha/beta fold hydrolase [Streptomyces sp. MUM 203J]
MQQPREHVVEVAPGVRLWVEERGDADAPPLLLIMGSLASGITWPEELVDALAERHRVVRYDHRDTGRSTWSFASEPYPLTDLAKDALAVLDALGIERAHVVGMSLGGMLTQLVMADRPERLLSATLIATGVLSSAPYTHPDGTVTAVDELPPFDPRWVAAWERREDGWDLAAELDWRVEHWRLLGGEVIPFDAEEARELELRVIEHTGHHRVSLAHALADQSGMERTEELAANKVPTLVVGAPEDPLFPPPHPQRTAQAIGGARLVEIPGMGHALPSPVLGPLADAVLSRTAGT